MNFARFLRTAFLTEHLRWLFLNKVDNSINKPRSFSSICGFSLVGSNVLVVVASKKFFVRSKILNVSGVSLL